MNELSKLSKTMSSLEISELTGKAHDKVRIDIERTLSEAKIGVADFRGTYRSKQGKALPCFNLPRRECDLVISGYSVKYRLKIIDRWQELEKSNLPTIPKNYAEALQLAADQAKEIEFKNDLIIASNEASIKAGDIKVSEFVKSTDIVNLGRNQFYEWMRKQGILFANSCEPIQNYVSRGFLKWLPTSEEHGGKIRYTLFVTARGKVWLAAKYMNYLDNEQ